MILKASQRGSGQNLAVHLMRLDDNEHMSLHELRGFASDNLKDAFREAEAIAKGTKCSQYLFSLSVSAPADAPCALRVEPHRCRNHDGAEDVVFQDQAHGRVARSLS